MTLLDGPFGLWAVASPLPPTTRGAWSPRKISLGLHLLPSGSGGVEFRYDSKASPTFNTDEDVV